MPSTCKCLSPTGHKAALVARKMGHLVRRKLVNRQTPNTTAGYVKRTGERMNRQTKKRYPSNSSVGEFFHNLNLPEFTAMVDWLFLSFSITVLRSLIAANSPLNYQILNVLFKMPCSLSEDFLMKPSLHRLRPAGQTAHTSGPDTS